MQFCLFISVLFGSLRSSPAISGYLRLSPAISGYLRLSPVISGHLRSSPAISGHPRISQVNSCYFWKSPAIFRHACPFSVILGYLRSFKLSPDSPAISGHPMYLLSFPSISSQPRLSISGHPRLSPATPAYFRPSRYTPGIYEWWYAILSASTLTYYNIIRPISHVITI